MRPEILTREDGTPFKLGRGAMGVTYKAFDINLRCPVTLKVISVPDDRHLDLRRKKLKQAIISFVGKQDFELAGFETEQFGTGQAKNLDIWTVEKANKLIRRCDGALILALARTRVRLLDPVNGGEGRQGLGMVFALPTPYNHLEGALAISQQLPLVILFEENMDRAGIFNCGTKTITIPMDADRTWLKSKEFQKHFSSWAVDVREWRDVFLGYCSKANSAAKDNKGLP